MISPESSRDRPRRRSSGRVQQVRLGTTALRPDSELFELEADQEREAAAETIQHAGGAGLDSAQTHAMPYLRATVRLDASGAAQAVWSGSAPQGRTVSLWAQEPDEAGSWRLLGQIEGRGQRAPLELTAALEPQLLHPDEDGHPVMAHLLVLAQDDFAAPVLGAEPGFADSEDYDFAILHISDTQHLAEGAAQTRDPQRAERFRDSIAALTDWVARNAGPRKIAYAVHTGDLVQHWCWWWDRRSTAEAEFAVACEMIEAIEQAGVPCGVLPGNHDNRRGSDDQDDGGAPELSLYNTWFGPQRRPPQRPSAFEGAETVRGGTWRPEDSSCHYDLLEIGGTRLLMLHLGYGVDDEQIEWADTVLQNHSDRDAILCTHHFLDAGTRPDGSGAPWGGPRSFGPDDGVRLQERLVSRNANVVLVLSGHVSGTGWNIDRSDPAHPSTAVLADYQAHRLREPQDDDDPRGEARTGFVRLLQFRAADGEMRISTYSPVLDSFDPDAHAPAEQLERLRLGAPDRPAPWDPGASAGAAAGGQAPWADPHQLVLPVSLRTRTTRLRTQHLGVQRGPQLTPAQDAHGLVRPDRWGMVLGAAGALAVSVVRRTLRRG